MHYKELCRTLSTYIWLLILPLLLPLVLALYCDHIAPENTYLQPHSTLAFIFTILVTAFLGFLFWLIGRKSSHTLYRREALLLVLAFYFITPFISALPFYFSGTLDHFTDAYFEATSGLTTTGATIMEGKKIDSEKSKELLIEKGGYSYYGTIMPLYNRSNKEVIATGIEAVAPSLLFWRSLMQWLGGCGFIVLCVAIFPALGVGGKILYQTEVTGISKESMMPRIKETASQLWKIYLGLTLAQMCILFFAHEGLSLFDAVTLSLSTLSTGGFTPNNGGIIEYNSVVIEYIIMLFMVLGAINFGLYSFIIRGKFARLKDPELRVFLLIILFAVAFTTWQLMGKEVFSSFFEALRHGSFQVIAAITSTGFSTANYDLWPFTIQVLILILMFVGGMGGSTSGGMKVVRQQTFFHVLVTKIESIFRPDAVRQYRVGTTIIDNNKATTALCFFMIVTSLTILGTFLLVLDGIDPETSLTTISCMVNNGGMGFRAGGPTTSFAFLSPFGKWLSCIWMIAGRLEFYTLLIAFIPAFWRSN